VRSVKYKILHTEASDGWGGQEIRIFNEILGMRERGHIVMLAAPPHARIFGRCEEAGVKCFAVPMAKKSFIPSVFRITSLLRDERVDIIGTHSSRDSWIGSLAGRLANVPVVRYRHISSELKRDPLTRFAYGRMNDAIITTGDFIKTQIERDLGVAPAKVHAIPTGVNIDYYEGADGSKLRTELGLGADDRVVGCASVLRSWKGHEYLIKAMPAVLGKVPSARLVIAGEGPMRFRLEQWVGELDLPDRVILLGHREDIADVIAAFDVSVLASYASEGIPQFLLQSMASKKPVVGARTGGIPEVIEDGVNGFLVPVRDESAIAEAVIRVLSDPAGAAGMGEAGLEMVRRRHTSGAMLDRIESLYSELLAARKV